MTTYFPQEWYCFFMDKEAQERLSSLLKKIQGDRTVKQFGIDIGVKAGTLGTWINKESLPTLTSLQLIAELAEMSLDELYAYLSGIESDSGKVAPTKLEVIVNLASQLPTSELAESVVKIASRLPKDEMLRAIGLLAEAARNK